MRKKIPIIYVDTREQCPYAFKKNIVKKRALKTGDYTISGGTGKGGIVIERKSLADLFNTIAISSNRRRFEDELKRMRQFGYRVLIIEGMVWEVEAGSIRSSINGAQMLAYVLELCLKYKVAPIFCGDRAAAETVTTHLLLKYHALGLPGRWWCHYDD